MNSKLFPMIHDYSLYINYIVTIAIFIICWVNIIFPWRQAWRRSSAAARRWRRCPRRCPRPTASWRWWRTRRCRWIRWTRGRGGAWGRVGVGVSRVFPVKMVIFPWKMVIFHDFPMKNGDFPIKNRKNYGTSPFLMGKSTIKWQFSRVFRIKMVSYPMKIGIFHGFLWTFTRGYMVKYGEVYFYLVIIDLLVRFT